MSNVLSTPAAPPSDAVAHFAGRLAFETDVSDVHADLEARVPDVVVVDTRGPDAWRQGHIPGAVLLATGEIAASAAELVPAGCTVVTYCWGPGCNGSTVAALEFARLGFPVKEMIGGYEYWVREGYPVRDERGVYRRTVDDLTGPAAGSCGC
ncbi:rhodanese-like domain-containing protein [Actinoplanes sp. NPDC051475]|uniref:rhodanese-like domain-containing protein n=1 Tax=Actinoplanes sp. NPDC051475 TaxID=3157225 RepID=UPI00344EE724